MSKRRYRFEIADDDGETIETRECRCYAAQAPAFAARLLARAPKAAAVFAVECEGRLRHAAYRG